MVTRSFSILLLKLLIFSLLAVQCFAQDETESVPGSPVAGSPHAMDGKPHRSIFGSLGRGLYKTKAGAKACSRAVTQVTDKTVEYYKNRPSLKSRFQKWGNDFKSEAGKTNVKDQTYNIDRKVKKTQAELEREKKRNSLATQNVEKLTHKHQKLQEVKSAHGSQSGSPRSTDSFSGPLSAAQAAMHGSSRSSDSGSGSLRHRSPASPRESGHESSSPRSPGGSSSRVSGLFSRRRPSSIKVKRFNTEPMFSI